MHASVHVCLTSERVSDSILPAPGIHASCMLPVLKCPGYFAVLTGETGQAVIGSLCLIYV